MLETKLGPLEEQYVPLTAESSLRPHISFKFFHYILFIVCVCTHIHASHNLYVEVRGQPLAGSSLLPLCVLRIEPRLSNLHSENITH